MVLARADDPHGLPGIRIRCRSPCVAIATPLGAVIARDRRLTVESPADPHGDSLAYLMVTFSPGRRACMAQGKGSKDRVHDLVATMFIYGKARIRALCWWSWRVGFYG